MSCEGIDGQDEKGSATALKEAGNVKFKNKDVEGAVESYTKALKILGEVPASGIESEEDSALRCILFTNRSNAYAVLKMWQKSLLDAKAALETDPGWAKAYFRCGAALCALGRKKEALKVYKTAREACNKTDSQTFVPLIRKLQLERIQIAKSSQKFPSLYPDRPGVGQTQEEKDRISAQRTLERLGAKLGDGGADSEVLLDGLFSRMLDPEAFRKIVYGSAAKLPETSTLPRTLQEMLANSAYVDALVELFPRIVTKANSVLENVKAKAAKENQIMDPATEQMLRPQVLNEALAHQLVDMIQDVNRKQSAILAESGHLVASTEVDEASLDQIPISAVSDLVNKEKAYTIIDGFLEDSDGEWLELLHADVADIAAAGLLEARDVSSGSLSERFVGTAVLPAPEKPCHSCWLSLDQLEMDFQALHEVATRLLAFPHELNKKHRTLKLSKFLSSDKILLTVLGPLPDEENDDVSSSNDENFCGLERRRDGSSGAANNGFKLTATYFFNSNWDSKMNGGDLVLYHPNETSVSINPIADRLVIYRSRIYENETKEIKSTVSQARCALTVFLSGPQDQEEMPF